MDMSAFLTSEGLAVSQRLERSVHCPLHTPDGMVTLITFSTAEGCKYPLK